MPRSSRTGVRGKQAGTDRVVAEAWAGGDRAPASERPRSRARRARRGRDIEAAGGPETRGVPDSRRSRGGGVAASGRGREEEARLGETVCSPRRAPDGPGVAEKPASQKPDRQRDLPAVACGTAKPCLAKDQSRHALPSDALAAGTGGQSTPQRQPRRTHPAEAAPFADSPVTRARPDIARWPRGVRRPS